ncbi:MAG TPA: hypothetical protein VGF48_06730 [Thermoanaerobaculia bacterium]|jgi:GWxTD domain-containing protein
MKSFIAAVALCAVAFTAQAGLSGEYKNWENSPQGYFMTAAERSEWKSINTDEAAAEFVKKFAERRGGDKWVAEVNKRAEMADKYLSHGKVKGSSMLRGKLIVLFGAPTNIAVASETRSGGGSNGLDSGAMNNVGSSGGAAGGDGGSDANAIGRGGSSRSFKIYTFTFSNKTTPALGKGEYVAVVEVDAGTGKDRLKESRKQPELESLIDAVAAASIVK